MIHVMYDVTGMFNLFTLEAAPTRSAFRTLLRKPKHGMKESETTRYVQNLKATGSDASLRLILPSP